MKTPKPFVGIWHITETEGWDKEALDVVVPAHITFEAEGPAFFQMIAVQGDIDARFEGNRVEFSWIEDDDGHESNGRGYDCEQHAARRFFATPQTERGSSASRADR